MDTVATVLGTGAAVVYGAAVVAVFGLGFRLLTEYVQGQRALRRARIEAELDAKQEEMRAVIYRIAQELHRDALRSGRRLDDEAARRAPREDHE